LVSGQGRPCVAQALRPARKDQNFVGALLDAGLVDPAVVAERLDFLSPRFEASA
jgi:hypothetical protein